MYVCVEEGDMMPHMRLWKYIGTPLIIDLRVSSLSSVTPTTLPTIHSGQVQ